MILSSGLVNFGSAIALDYSCQLIYYGRGPYARTFLPAKTITQTAAEPPLSAEGVRGALPSAAGAPALLQRRVPGSGEGMVALEGAGKISGDQGLQAATERSKPTLPGAREKPETAKARGSSRGREGHHYRTFFSTIRATGLAATWDLSAGGEVLYNASARTTAGARWSVCGNGSSVGSRRAT